MPYIGNQPSESFTSFATQEFSTSATTSYTLDHAVTNENEIALFINNVRQQPGSGKAYTATGTTLTLSEATASTDTMYCVFLGRALQTVTPATNSITAAMVGNDLISGKDALTSSPADTDELLISDAGVLKRIDVSLVGGKNTPSFEAHLGSNQTGVANDTSVKVQFATEVFDSDGTYDNSTNYRFTPAVAGKYFVYSSVEGNGGGGNSDLDELSNQIYLNGSVYRYNQNKYTSNPVKYVNVQTQAIMDLDTDDYVEIYAHIKSNSSSSSNLFSASNKKTYFGAFKIIGA